KEKTRSSSSERPIIFNTRGSTNLACQLISQSKRRILLKLKKMCCHAGNPASRGSALLLPAKKTSKKIAAKSCNSKIPITSLPYKLCNACFSVNNFTTTIVEEKLKPALRIQAVVEAN